MLKKCLFGALSIYAGVGCATTLYPQLIWTPRPDLEKTNKNFDKWIVAHRGGSLERPENTLDSFRHAYNLNVDILEMDVVRSQEGTIVVSHENNLKRLAGVDKLISETNFNDLPPYMTTFFTHFAFEKLNFENKVYKFTDLETVFKEFPDIYMVIEIKEPNEETIKEVKRLIDKYDRQHLTFTGNSRQKENEKIQEIISKEMTFISAEKALKLFFAYFLGFVAFIPVEERLLGAPIMTKPFNALKYANSPWYIAFPYEMMARAFVFFGRGLNNHLKKRGVKVFYWVINSNEDAIYALGRNCDGCITDAPTTLMRFYNKLKVN